MARPAFLSLAPGSIVFVQGRTYEIKHLLGVDRLLASDTETKALEQFRIDQLAAVGPEDGNAASVPRPPEEYSEKQWRDAESRLAVIQPLLQNPHRTRADAERVAATADVNVATIYEWMRLYRDSGHLSSLIPAKRGRKKGNRKLPKEAEKIVEAAISEVLLTKQKHKAQVVVEAVQERCRIAKIPAPHPNTVRNRIREQPQYVVMSRRGLRDQARNQFEPIRGNFPGADFPLAVIQIDHTPADVVIVESRSRLPLGRPWITLAIDVYSRMVVGSFVSMEAPSAASVGMCLSRAMLPKSEYLAHLEVPGDWPVWGKMRTVHSDNAKEFRGAALKRACDEYAIDLQFRPVRLPKYGGHIERLMGTAANEIRKLPGATFSSPKEREGYDSDKESAFTLDEFEQYLADFIVNIYHQRKHAELGVPPRRQWEMGILGDALQPGTGLPELPGDAERLRIAFLPFVERTVQNYGLAFEGVNYYREVLNPWINAVDPGDSRRKRQFRVHYDPADLSCVYFYDPTANEYYAIPYRNMAHPPVSIWELRAARQRLQAEGQRHVDEDALFESVQRLRVRVESAIKKTKAARRQQHRIDQIKRLTTAAPKPSTVASPAAPTSLALTVEDDIFTRPLVPLEVEVRS